MVLIVGLGVGALGSWWMIRARPRPGRFVDALATEPGAIVVRGEVSSQHSFVEVRDLDGDHPRLRWRGLVPTYAAVPGHGAVAVAAAPGVMTVRVRRGGHPRVFAFDIVNGAKLDSFDLIEGAPPDPAAYTLAGVATVGAGGHAVEVVARPGGGGRLIGVDLTGRRLVWRRDLAEAPVRAWADREQVVVAGAGGDRSAFSLTSGEPVAATAPPPDLGGLTYDPGRRELIAPGGQRYPLPEGAVAPAPYHVAGGRIWVVTPAAITVLAIADLHVIATIR